MKKLKTAQAMELIYLTSGDEDVLHEGDEDERPQSSGAVTGLCQAGGKGKKISLVSWLKLHSNIDFFCLRPNWFERV